jgi:hypothetical protein
MMKTEQPSWSWHALWVLAGALLLSVMACAASPPAAPTPLTLSPIVRTVIATGKTPNPTLTRLSETTSAPTTPRPTVAPPPADTATVVASTQIQLSVSTDLPATATLPSIGPTDVPTTPPSPTLAVAEGPPTSTVVASTQNVPAPTSTTAPPAIPTTAKTAAPRATPTLASSTHTYYLSSYGTATYYYCDTDPGWKTLSPKYLKQFPSADAALAAYPGLKLHKPC